MTEQTDAAEVALIDALTEARCHQCGHDALAHNAYPWRDGRCRFTGYMCDCRLGLAAALARWLATDRAAAEVRGAQAVLAAVEAQHAKSFLTDGDEAWGANPVCDWDERGYPCETLTAARAAAAAAGGGGEA